jgi:GNAT superfamily N-acetyltransferase
MLQIDNTNLKYLNHIERIARVSNEYMVPNNRMIYYLCCTVFTRYSFVAIKDHEPIGYLFAFSDSDSKYIWIHQLAVIPEERNKGIGGRLLIKLKRVLESENSIRIIRFAVRKENIPSWKIAIRQNCQSFGTDPYLDMEIFEKRF